MTVGKDVLLAAFHVAVIIAGPTYLIGQAREAFRFQPGGPPRPCGRPGGSGPRPGSSRCSRRQTSSCATAASAPNPSNLAPSKATSRGRIAEARSRASLSAAPAAPAAPTAPNTRLVLASSPAHAASPPLDSKQLRTNRPLPPSPSRLARLPCSDGRTAKSLK